MSNIKISNKPPKPAKVMEKILSRVNEFTAKWEVSHREMLAKQNELVAKHNDLTAQNAALEGLVQGFLKHVMSEQGKFQGLVQNHLQALGHGMYGVDVNVLALAEISKEILGQLTQVDFIFKKFHSGTKKIIDNSHGKPPVLLVPGDIEAFNNVLEISTSETDEIKNKAEAWYKDLLASAFKTAREKMAQQEKEAHEKAAEEAAKAKELALAEEASLAAVAEAENVEKELKKAELDERGLVHTPSGGGQGSPFPDGAEIFGG